MVIVHLSGPCYSGKSYLISRLVQDFPDLNVILFEKHIDAGKIKDKYEAFYSDIEESAKNGIVVAESIYSSTNKILSYNFNSILNVVCFPSFKDHQTNLNKYISQFGKDELYKARTGRINLSMLRQDYMTNGYPKDNKVLYNLHNYENIKREIENVFRLVNNSKDE